MTNNIENNVDDLVLGILSNEPSKPSEWQTMTAPQWAAQRAARKPNVPKIEEEPRDTCIDMWGDIIFPIATVLTLCMTWVAAEMSGHPIETGCVVVGTLFSLLMFDTTIRRLLIHTTAPEQERIPTIKRRYVTVMAVTLAIMTFATLLVAFECLVGPLLLYLPIELGVLVIPSGHTAWMIAELAVPVICILFLFGAWENIYRFSCPYCGKRDPISKWTMYQQDRHCSCKHCGFKWKMHWT